MSEWKKGSPWTHLAGNVHELCTGLLLRVLQQSFHPVDWNKGLTNGLYSVSLPPRPPPYFFCLLLNAMPCWEAVSRLKPYGAPSPSSSSEEEKSPCAQACPRSASIWLAINCRDRARRGGSQTNDIAENPETQAVRLTR